jgi:hypothetical protein
LSPGIIIIVFIDESVTERASNFLRENKNNPYEEITRRNGVRKYGINKPEMTQTIVK